MDSLTSALRYATKQHAEMTKVIMDQQEDIEDLVDELDAERIVVENLENEQKRIVLERDDLAKQVVELAKERDELKRQLSMSRSLSAHAASPAKFDFSKPHL